MYTVDHSHELPDAPGHTLEDPGPKPVMRLSREQARALRDLFADSRTSPTDGYALIDEGSGYRRVVRFEPSEGRKIGEALIFADGGCAGWQDRD
jgi:hypothetical protein